MEELGFLVVGDLSVISFVLYALILHPLKIDELRLMHLCLFPFMDAVYEKRKHDR